MTFTLSGEVIIVLVVNAMLIAVAFATLREQVKTLMDKARGHDDVRDAVTELRAELRMLREAIAVGPANTANVVAATLKEVFQAFGVKRLSNA